MLLLVFELMVCAILALISGVYFGFGLYDIIRFKKRNKVETLPGLYTGVIIGQMFISALFFGLSFYLAELWNII